MSEKLAGETATSATIEVLGMLVGAMVITTDETSDKTPCKGEYEAYEKRVKATLPEIIGVTDIGSGTNQPWSKLRSLIRAACVRCIKEIDAKEGRN